MVVACEIVFDQNEHGTYFAGQTISGSIILKTDKTKTIKGLALKINGFSRTKWTENINNNNNTNSKANSNSKIITYYGSEDYIANQTYLLGSEESETLQIEPGIYNYTFTCALPRHCPSSFEGTFGHIRYVIKVVLFRPWKFDQTYSRGFTVLKLMDLNYESPVLRVPAAQETFKTFCCGPCTSLPMNMNVSVPQTGYVPGEEIIVKVTVKNESTVPVVDLKISLVMLVTLFCKHPTTKSRSERKNLAKLRAGVIDSKSTRTLSQSIRVPATPPTCFNLCYLIKISYELEVLAKLKGMHQIPLITIPITIGNVPIFNVIDHQPMRDSHHFYAPDPSAPQDLEEINSIEGMAFTMSSGNMLPIVDPVQNPLDRLSSIDLQIPPPSYEEALFMTRVNCNEDDPNALGKCDFLPRYPVYSAIQPCAPLEDEPFTNTDPNKSTWL